uniref:Uncharacterized protein n=1 Tax=Anguilla anguilla TaxID=7936 RepID=A0A0E9UTN5_ANGAN
MEEFFHSVLDKIISIWSFLCAQGHCYAVTGKGQTVGEAQNRPECDCMLVALRFAFTGTKGPS